MERTEINKVLKNSLNWFLHSSVMNPGSGFWGVAERVFVCPDAELRKGVFQSFNSYTDHSSWSVVESRRADCNFQTAYLFLLASALGFADCRSTAENLLDFLYFRSGLLNRSAGFGGVWNWSHTEWRMTIWFDDNSWCLLIPLLILRRDPALARRYDMLSWAEKLADQLALGFERTFQATIGKEERDLSDPDGIWRGRPFHPHWGALCCMALAAACHAGFPKSREYANLIRKYHEFLAKKEETTWNVSEFAYALIGATAAYRFLADPLYLELASSFADRILAKADPVTGNVPSEHYEAPTGPHLVDMIYTMNWTLLGFQNLVRLLPENPVYRQQYEKMLKLFADIQDASPESQFNGCWRGMYDMKSRSWGGGDLREGGAGSIYSGWTNAPVAIVFANELFGTSLIG